MQQKQQQKKPQCHFSAERGCLSFKMFLLSLDSTLKKCKKVFNDILLAIKKPHEKYVNSGWDQRVYSGGYNSLISC